jgi:hypothetical protein
MAGAPNPYGTQEPPGQMPAFDPRGGKQKGSTAPKVWGIVLLVFGGMGIINGLMNLASAMNPGLGMGMSTSTMPDEQREAFEAAMKPMLEETFSSPVFWVSIIFGILIAGFSIWTGIRLIKSKPGSWRLAAIRAVLVVGVLMPLEIWQGVLQSKHMESLQKAMMASSGPSGPPPELMGNIMSATMWATIIATAVFTIAVNMVLLLMMTRPAVKEYLDSGAGQSDVPGYNPHMGMAGPPPAPPQAAPVPPGNPPSEPPPQA